MALCGFYMYKFGLQFFLVSLSKYNEAGKKNYGSISTLQFYLYLEKSAFIQEGQKTNDKV